MISYLRLSNFRRHEDLELRFTPDQQLILVSGKNGVGKTTLFESILFGLYGQSRHGKRSLNRLIRRGAELEGMEVELEFAVGATTYRVKRRRDGKAATAVLYGNDQALVEGSNEVTDQVTKVLGMDAAGFKVAVVAQQSELDGLASLTASERAAMLSRLLRLDAIANAKQDARQTYRTHQKVVAGLGSGLDVDGARQAAKDAATGRDEVGAALKEANGAVVELEAKLALSAAVETAWQKAQTDIARAEGASGTAGAEVARIEAALETLVVPDEVEEPEVPLERLEAAAADVERDIVRAEHAAQVAEQRALAEAERDRAIARLNDIAAEQGRIGTSEDVAARAGVAEAELVAAEAALADAQQHRDELRGRHADIQAALTHTASRRDATVEVGATCERCGQDVDEEHRTSELARLDAELGELAGQLDEVTAEGKQAGVEVEAAAETVEAAKQACTEAGEEAALLSRLASERAEAERRRDTYAKQLDRLAADDYDLDELYARKGELAVAVALAKQAADAIRKRDELVRRRDELTGQLEEARTRLADAEAALEAAAVDSDLQAAYDERLRLLETRDEEVALANHLATEHAAAVERAKAAEAAVARSEQLLDRRREHEQAAQAAENAARLLGDVGERLATQIRPALEGTVSALIAKLSDGRFDSVSIDPDYNIRVRDDGAYRDLGDLSGGEKDLVALAVRLGLAEVVSDRHGAGGAGFLILDECFGSQDPDRRAAILNALRSLRDTYGQVWLISHVGGLEDAADVVVDVSTSPDRTLTEVVVR